MTATPRVPPPVESLDIVTMRASASLLIGDGAEPPTGEDLSFLIAGLRGHLNLLIPELASRIGRHDPDLEARARAGMEQAHHRLAGGPSSLGSLRHAECLARSVAALCDHLEHFETAS